jgi:hypothetical protein
MTFNRAVEATPRTALVGFSKVRYWFFARISKEFSHVFLNAA